MTEAPKALAVDDDISLVPAHLADGDALFIAVRQNLPSLGEWLGWAADSYSERDVAAFIQASSDGWSSGAAHTYAIEYRGQVRGTVGVDGLKSPARTFEIGYWLAAEARGRGVMTKSCRALLQEAFERLDANLVEIRAAPGNQASRAIAERLGMRQEGTLRQRSNNARGEILDLVVYSITRSEWQTAGPR